jgi:hypothetical protein
MRLGSSCRFPHRRLQTDTGWPEKVSGRAQDPIIDDLPPPILEGASIDESGLAQAFRRNRVYQGISGPLVI